MSRPLTNAELVAAGAMPQTTDGDRWARLEAKYGAARLVEAIHTIHARRQAPAPLGHVADYLAEHHLEPEAAQDDTPAIETRSARRDPPKTKPAPAAVEPSRPPLSYQRRRSKVSPPGETKSPQDRCAKLARLLGLKVSTVYVRTGRALVPRKAIVL